MYNYEYFVFILIYNRNTLSHKKTYFTSSFPSFVDFDYSFIFFIGWFQYVAAAASALASVYGAQKSARSIIKALETAEP
jgi:hypothetical protein